MPLTADFATATKWGPGRLSQAVAGHNELTEDDYKAARAKSAYFAFPRLIKFKLTSHEIDATQLVATRDAAFAWLNENSTGRWFLDDEFDHMTSPLKIFIERDTDREKFLAAFPSEFDAGQIKDHNLLDACTALGLVTSPKEEFDQWIQDNELYSFSRDETNASVFTFRDAALKQDFIDSFSGSYDLQFISDDVCRLPFLNGEWNAPLSYMQKHGRAFEFAIDGYHVGHPGLEQRLREKWGASLTDKGRDENGRAILAFTPGAPANLDSVVAVYTRYLAGEIEWTEVLAETGAAQNSAPGNDSAPSL